VQRTKPSWWNKPNHQVLGHFTPCFPRWWCIAQGSSSILTSDHIELIAQRSSLADSRTYRNVSDCRYLISLYGACFRNGPFKLHVEQIPVSAYLSQIFSGAIGHKTCSNYSKSVFYVIHRKFEKRPE